MESNYNLGIVKLHWTIASLSFKTYKEDYADTEMIVSPFTLFLRAHEIM